MRRRNQGEAGRMGGRISPIRLVVSVAALLLAATAATAQSIAIRGATIVPVSGPRIANGTVVITGDRITAVGANVAVPAGARVIEAHGKFVFPGMIDSWTQLGLSEISSVAGGQDESELGEFNPAMASGVALNPHSELIPVTRVNGITTVLTGPTGGRISGVASLVNLDGWTPREMALTPLAALIVNFPQMGQGGRGGGRRGGGGGEGTEEERRRRIERQVKELEEYFDRSVSYAERRSRNALPRLDRHLEAMMAAVRGEMPVIVFANNEQEILGAIKLADKYRLRLVLGGAREAWKVADTLAARRVPVILGSVLSNPGRDDPFDAIYAAPGVLARKGVTFAFSTGGASDVRNLPYHAQMALGHGLSPDTALLALTIWPARMLGIADKVGSIENGKQADLFIATGEPLDVRTTVEQVFIRGVPIDMDSRHTKLYQDFKARPKK